VITTFDCLLNSENALNIVQEYDVILDCSDNAVTRYLVNDACVILGKPLVSGAALRLDGQLSTYHFNGSACYRCIYPMPPNAELVVNCDVGGVLGPVTGTIGSLQALEALRILSSGQSSKIDYAFLRFE
jgi:adenylyltransferase/sulfurtransferase